MSESRLSVDGFAVAGEHEFFAADHAKRPGAFYFVRDVEAGKPDRLGIWVLVPSEAWGVCAGRLPLNCPDGWTWDGNQERPTLSPSIHCVDHWHGYLRAGRFESC